MHRSLRAFLAAALSASVVAVPAAGPAGAAPAPQAVRDFTISGTGWGHGIGMSQYGAQGFALKGYTYDRILTHYYQKTTLRTLESLFGAKDKNPTVRVNIDRAKRYRSSWTIKGYKSELRVSSGSTSLTLGNNAYQTFTAKDGKIVVAGRTLGSSASVSAASGSPKLLVVKDASGPPLHKDHPNGYPYMRYRGSIRLTASGNTLKAVNHVPMESYLYGVVPRESPSSWRAEALKAQAVAARSYAWATNPDQDRNGTLDGELYCTTSSQVYGAHSRLRDGSDSNVYMHEASSTNSAVNATAGRVVYYTSTSHKTVVTTYFFSQSGGRTANIEDVWVSATPRPYHRSVSDPYESLAGAPYCPWPSDKEKRLSGLQLADKLRAAGISGVPGGSAHVTGVITERAASGYPRYVTFRFSEGSSVKVSGWTVRGTFGLLSPMFYFSGFPISRIYGSDRYSTAVEISKRAFPTTAPTVVIASGEDFADALTGSGLAGASGGSLLLSRRGSLPSETARELARLAPSTVYLMGGGPALTAGVESAVRAKLPAATVMRIAGQDRYTTAEKAAAEISEVATANGGEPPAKALLVSGTSWPDAAAASVLAYAQAYPILLTRRDALHGASARALRALKPEQTLVAGSDAVVSAGAASAAATASGGSVKRLAGSDRYATSVAIARYLGGGAAPEGVWSRDEVYLATGYDFPDALAGGVLAGKMRRPMLLTRRDRVAPPTAAYLRENRSYIQRLWIFGSRAAVTDSAFAALDATMMN
ncbi:MAG: SpoIID/LytB domain-containing protein [Coriobacteriia bacterium]|nr:SpoIID/LytB domain-containing protein [Coriobacteriia bacterium]